MLTSPHIYAVIIGSEILNLKREDKHFSYLSKALSQKGHTLFSSFIIKDDKKLITQVFKLIQADKDAMMFCFGGIGSTPDDLTRQLSANVFGDTHLYRHPQFERDILNRLGERAYPFAIHMSDLPKNADLLHNPVNNMSGFSLDNKLFFMPGFPEMAQPMIDAIIQKHLLQAPKLFSLSFLAQCGEGKIQALMDKVDVNVELSSLPMMNAGKPQVEFSLSAYNFELLKQEFDVFINFLISQNIGYKLL